MNAVTVDRVERSFSRSFQSYHDTASQQAKIAQNLAQRLCDLGAPQRFGNAFEIGCGTGHLTQAMHRHFSFTSLTLNDLTPAACTTADAMNAIFLPGDARDIRWPKTLDLIVSASTIQWLDAPEHLVNRAAGELAPNGWLAISGFGAKQYRELAKLGSTASAPGLCSADNLVEAVCRTSAGLMEVLDRGEDCWNIWFNSPKDVLKHLRHTGVNAGAARPWTRASLARFCEDYIQIFGDERGVPLTYNPVWIIARKTG
jgi:malonyl-CoA O-methyltransferase